MNVIKSMVRKTLVGLLVVFALGLAFLYLTPHGKFLRLMGADGRKNQQRKVRLLSETDHAALLAACRELLREISAGNLRPYRYRVHYEPGPKTSRLPQIILDLEPMVVDTEDRGRVIVELGSAFHHSGVTAYAEDYEKPSPYFEYGDKKIIDGLWYYEDGYNPKHDKWVEKQLQKGSNGVRVPGIN